MTDLALDVRHDGAVLRLTLDRPARRNALDDATTEALVAELEAANQDESVRVITLTGAGSDFCSGFDLGTRGGDGARPRVGSLQRRLPALAHRLVSLVCSVQVPVVAVVRGWCAGLGLHLAVAADFCVAAEDARFWEPFTARGFTPDSGGTWLLPRRVGVTRANELLLLGRELSGAEAAEWGLIHAAVAPDDLDARAETLVGQLASGPTVALGLTKWLVHTGAGLDLDRHLANEALALELSSRTSDFREGIAALRERRDARFDGR
ncbi:MAG TPA: enoyl-CoA hydratase/isomerase family protein [Acidimicrobiia bacterium]|nr:enoyl-CoA hydratase/isomerase family protein [Acidimicrobiia bacterium]